MPVLLINAALKQRNSVHVVGLGAVWVRALPWELHSHGGKSMGMDSRRHSTRDAHSCLTFLP